MIQLGSTVVLGATVKDDKALIGLESKIFEVFDHDLSTVSIRSVPNGTIIIHGLSKTEVVLHRK